MSVNWSTTGTLTFRLHQDHVHIGDLTNFLLRLIICCLLEKLLGEPIPRREASALIASFSYIAQAMVAAFDQSSLNNLLQLLKTAGDGTAMPSFTALLPDPLLCARSDHARLSLGDSVCHQLLLLHPLRSDSRSSVRSSSCADDQDLPREVLPLSLTCFISFAMIRAVAAAFIFCLGWLHERLSTADVQWQLFDGNVDGEPYPVPDGLRSLHHQHALHPQHDPGYFRRRGRPSRPRVLKWPQES